MDLNTRLQNVAVIGAAGKMGSGISLLLAQELGFASLENRSRTFILNLVDISDLALQGLIRYIKEQSVKTAEKQINRLRELYKDRVDLVENGEIINEFVHEVLVHIRTGKTLDLAKDSLLVFEAVFEKEELKFEVYNKLASLCPKETYFLTNTSSIPIKVITDACGIDGRVIGYHFYNPPAVQKLVELITPDTCDEELKVLSLEIAKKLGKKIVPANDIAGFIGNGHFMRDGLHAISEVKRLSKEHGYPQAIYMVDKVSRDYLLRPMGIFQLIDYVGIDVFQLILKVMNKYLTKQGLHSDLIDKYMEQGVKGGQTSSGAQKDGFLKYEKGKPVGVYNPETKEYVPVDDIFIKAVDEKLGLHPNPSLSWKNLLKDPEKDSKTQNYFTSLKEMDTLGAELARRYYNASKETSEKLVKSGVANKPEDVNSVLTLGFFHLYGPINDYLK
ncbi:MAG: 3-hydroxyacyl-CoA dehydrogenase family protein [Candidatus Coatesbacteria bacterium]|nr:3-hydroxyacyl-CoA dehydrogenase family protein [Candidatus Coatesbacteria bacterium]